MERSIREEVDSGVLPNYHSVSWTASIQNKLLRMAERSKKMDDLVMVTWEYISYYLEHLKLVGEGDSKLIGQLETDHKLVDNILRNYMKRRSAIEYAFASRWRWLVRWWWSGIYYREIGNAQDRAERELRAILKDLEDEADHVYGKQDVDQSMLEDHQRQTGEFDQQIVTLLGLLELMH